MKKKRSLFPLTMHGVVSLLLPIPCYLILFVVTAFLSLLVPGSMESGFGNLVGVFFMAIAPVFSLFGIWRRVQRLRRRKRSKRAIACLTMCGLGLIEFIAVLVFTLRY